MENKSPEDRVRELEEKLRVQELEARLELQPLEKELRATEIRQKIAPAAEEQQPTWYGRAIWGLVGVILLFALLTSALRLWIAAEGIDGADTGDLTDAEVAVQRSEDAVESVNLLLSFLEGASVLVALALGAAAIYGYRQTNQIREEVEEELQKAREIRSVIESRRPQLERLSELDSNLQASITSLKGTIDDVSRLLQADQEFRRSNHQDAYRFVEMVLQHDEDNPQALYIAGWLETHHISGKLKEGIEHLRRLIEIDGNWPSARAAYGVALRRKAMPLRDAENKEPFINLMNEAEGELRSALGRSPKLVDFNHESFWGPVGGILRDLERIQDAIEAYRKALEITPGSSYPQGNLASLLLRRSKENGSAETLQEALKAYEKTVDFAKVELSTKPNDYFLIMDMAMSRAILASQQEDYLKEARENLFQALDMAVTPETLSTSLRGWEYMLEYLPEGPEWETVRQAILDAIEKIKAVIKIREPDSSSDSNHNTDDDGKSESEND